MLNKTNVTLPHHHPAIPNDAFLIKNRDSHTCLAPPHKRDLSSNPIDYHTHEALYPVVLVACDLQSHNQLWQWTTNNSLLHIATFLCLGALYENGESKLVLQTCKVGDFRQKWNCATNHIKEPETLQCITITAVWGRKRREVGVDFMMESRVRQIVPTSSMESDDNLRELERELGDVVRELHDFREQRMQGNTINNAQSQTENNIDPRYNVILDFCQSSSDLQKWTIVDAEGDDNQSSICSRRLSQTHNLPYCYPSNMQSASSVSSLVSKWVLCSYSSYYVSGFYHTYNIEQYNDRGGGLVSALKCCAGSFVFTGQENTPVQHGEEICEEKEWWERVEHNEILSTKGWFTCPRGMYLKGFLLSTRPYNQNENLIMRARCCRPAEGPEMYFNCYSDTTNRVLDTEVHACRMRGYHITGVVRKNCNYAGIYCDEILTCCM